jgi:hypothetical protein
MNSDRVLLPIWRLAVRHATAGVGCTTGLVCWKSTAPPISLAPGHRGLLDV